MSTVNGFDTNVADSTRFLDAVRLTEQDDAPDGHRVFTATTQYVPWPKAYGGDMVAQAVAAACATVPDKAVHSAHSYFLRPAEIGGDVRYEVEILRDGRGYATRHVRGLQGGKVIYTCYASFATAADGAEIPGAPLLGAAAAEGLVGVPDPESLPASAEALAGRDGADADYWSHGRSFEMRHVPDPIYLPGDRERLPRQAVWIKAFSDLPDDRTVHDVALAYCCDYTILEPSLRALGASWSDDGLRTASLDHAMWFHRPARLDDWVLYSQESINVGSSRGLNTGRFHDRKGTHLATVCQEGLLAQ
ncbi:acyl-CoA thioesterase [Tsukamurella pseudospumae]|uniref:Acyl-CoA thioesterase II n=1 Tax=Tsukamurella pseudospumae TaxID=239498 RepID=A0A138AX74_9ACTN|nr:acyl-CoA thioesterase domain-containing protein [Tsukamurella pseudospumae]KXP15041.1 acyl-CoA thioesterase II [Tsukamurella pseudospumae]